jgi:hypothetical protein
MLTDLCHWACTKHRKKCRSTPPCTYITITVRDASEWFWVSAAYSSISFNFFSVVLKSGLVL